MVVKKQLWISLLAALVAFSFTARAQEMDLQSQAKTLVNALAKRQFSEVEGKFDESMASGLPAAKLESTWDTLIGQFGDFKSITGVRQEEIQQYHVVLVTCHFTQRDLDAKVAYDSKGRVAGLFFLPAAAPPAPPASGASTAKAADVAGDWLGTLELGVNKLRIVFHIASAPGGLTATMDSPDQSATGLPVSSVQLSGMSLKLESEKLHGEFNGVLSADRASVEGTWKQGPASLPLVLKRAKTSAEWQRQPRPQEPSRPYPYRDEDVVYANKAAGNELAATLTIPSGKGPFPAVVLITGSGPQDRDESLMGHKPFLVLADYLTRKGIAVLRADDRGTAKSTGDFATATTADFATDTEAGIAFLKTRPEIDVRRIGLIGHSEGGIIAPMIAARNHDVAFIVMMAGSGVPGDEIIAAQSELIAEVMGQSHEEAVKVAATQRSILAIVKQSQDKDALEKQLHDRLALDVKEPQLGVAVKQLSSPWMRYFVGYDPAPALSKVKCPVLALNGEKDLQVPPKQNLPVIRKALEAGGNKNFEIDELPGLNHLFQTAKTGSPGEYSQIDETIAPLALEKISGWILKLEVQRSAN